MKGLLSLLALGIASALVAADGVPRVPPDGSAEGRYQFVDVIRKTAGHEIIAFDVGKPAHAVLLERLKAVASRAIRQARAARIVKARANEAGNAMEAHVLEALEATGLPAHRPRTDSGREQAAGYPDIEIESDPPCYLELKTYSARTARSSQRTFYYSPSAETKVTHDALHLLLAFEMEPRKEEDKTIWVPVRFKIVSLHDLEVRLKIEYNQSNRELYDSQRILADEPVD